MKEAGDIAGVVIPFTIGVFITVFAGSCFISHSGASFIPVFCLIISIIPLLHPARSRYGRTLQWGLVSICLMSAGMLCGLSSELVSFSSSGRVILKETLLGAGIAMQKAVDGIPFENPETNAIIKALLTGERSAISPRVAEAFRNSGASHILALSGMHLGIIYGIVSKMLQIIGNSPEAKTLRTVITVITCGAYTLATGAGPSITRALLFIVLAEIAKMFHRDRDLKTVLFSALLLQLTVRPQDAASVGFQLSYAAMAGIAFIYPKLKGFWPDSGGGILKWIWNSAALSLSCQITTGPLAWLYFHSFPVHFLLTNLIAIPLTGLIIPVSLMTLCLDICGICPKVLPAVTEELVSCLSGALEIISGM